MKYNTYALIVLDIPVAPLVGAWIEMHSKAQLVGNVVVAPLIGAGIEIDNAPYVF
ncbi:hypothetical protein [Bacillus sp. FSL R12-0074]|uniref:hypothetical protein n=1 Tax=Bacillus sp. FSL R12-0074 TaxID=2954664 RepID=UPI0030F9394E